MVETAFEKIEDGLKEALAVARGEAKPDKLYSREELLERLKKEYPGGQIPAKELYAPDPVAKSRQGPLEIVHATFANCRIRK